MATRNKENICLHNKFGHCKYKEQCKYRHIRERCERKECEGENCNLRHPRKCSYFYLYKRCKFSDYCSFSHDLNLTDPVQEKDDIDQRFKTLEKTNIELKEKRFNEFQRFRRETCVQ